MEIIIKSEMEAMISDGNSDERNTAYEFQEYLDALALRIN